VWQDSADYRGGCPAHQNLVLLGKTARLGEAAGGLGELELEELEELELEELELGELELGELELGELEPGEQRM